MKYLDLFKTPSVAPVRPAPVRTPLVKPPGSGLCVKGSTIYPRHDWPLTLKPTCTRCGEPLYDRTA